MYTNIMLCKERTDDKYIYRKNNGFKVFPMQDSDEENPFADDVGLGVKSMSDHL